VGGRIRAATRPRVVSGFLIPDVFIARGGEVEQALSTERARIAALEAPPTDHVRPQLVCPRVMESMCLG
jgi:hypothetical protein